MQYSPKLKKAMEEIKQVLLKHDIAGVIVLHTPGFSEYNTHIRPSYSCASVDPVKGHFQFKGRKEHFDNEADRYNKQRDTMNMITLLGKTTAGIAINLLEADEVMRNILKATDIPGGNTSGTTQNN